MDARCRHYGPVGGISKSPSDSRNLRGHFNRERKYPAERMIERMQDLVWIACNSSAPIVVQDSNLK